MANRASGPTASVGAAPVIQPSSRWRSHSGVAGTALRRPPAMNRALSLAKVAGGSSTAADSSESGWRIATCTASQPPRL